MPKEVFEKWGFGLAPPKHDTQGRRRIAAQCVLELVESGTLNHSAESALESLSEMKGLFNRVVRQDQWDWFIVAEQLGFPSAKLSAVMADALAQLRCALRDCDLAKQSITLDRLRGLPTRKCLAFFLGLAEIGNEPGAGWVYLLSTREQADLLKIGMTTRTVQQRVKEINSATGVAIPFGVRQCWRVTEPERAEKLIHEHLADYRIRADREFFRVDYFYARQAIQNALDADKIELRTLDRIAGLGGR